MSKDWTCLKVVMDRPVDIPVQSRVSSSVGPTAIIQCLSFGWLLGGVGEVGVGLSAALSYRKWREASASFLVSSYLLAAGQDKPSCLKTRPPVGGTEKEGKSPYQGPILSQGLS